ncbi:MAG: hypothetical protein ACRDJM_02125, partial [Actinomycetota bacterium]
MRLNLPVLWRTALATAVFQAERGGTAYGREAEAGEGEAGPKRLLGASGGRWVREISAASVPIADDDLRR